MSFLTGACNEYLSKNPNEGADQVLNQASQIEGMLNNGDLLLQSYAKQEMCNNDDWGWTTDIYDYMYGYFDAGVVNAMTWDITGTANTTYGDELWDKEYEKIFTANLIINEIDEVTDATAEQRANFLAQAHFIRALANWHLATVYCQPYAAETLNTLGLPLKRTTSYEESLVRATLKETYDFIEEDLLEALNTTRNDIESRIHVSKPAVSAMLARFYLFTMDYDQANKYADEALKSDIAHLQDYNALTRIERTINTGGDDYDDWDYTSDDSDDSGDDTGTTLYFSELYGMAGEEYMDYCEFYYPLMYQMSLVETVIPSQSLIDSYDADNDLRFEHFFVKRGLWEEGIIGYSDEDIRYCMFNHPYGYNVMMPCAPTVAEVILIKAEAMARLGQYSQAMTVLNQLREKRMRIGSDYSLTAADQTEAIREILNERHREMPFMGRWQDVRRLAYNETPEDDIELHRTFFTVSNNIVDTETVKDHVLPVKSKRYAQPIVELEIRRSNYQIVQNEY